MKIYLSIYFNISFDLAIKYHEADQLISEYKANINPLDYLHAKRNISVCYREMNNFESSLQYLNMVY